MSTMFTYIADAQGFFEEEGVDVEITDGHGANVTPLLTSGRADIIQNAAPAALSVADQGMPTIVLWGMVGGGAVGLLAGGPGVDSLDELREVDSCTLATFVPGSNTYGYAKAWVDAAVPNCEIQTYGDIQLAIASVTGGRADAVVASYNALQGPVQQERLNILVSADEIQEELDLEPFAEAIEMGLTENLESKREAVERYLTGVQRARAWFEDASDTEVAEALSRAEVYQGRTIDDLTDVAAQERPFMGQGTMDGHISPEQWQLMLDAVERSEAEVDADAPYAAYDERVDMSYLEAANESIENGGQERE